MHADDYGSTLSSPRTHFTSITSQRLAELAGNDASVPTLRRSKRVQVFKS